MSEVTELQRKYRKNDLNLNIIYEYERAITRNHSSQPNIKRIIDLNATVKNSALTGANSLIILGKNMLNWENSKAEIAMLKELLGIKSILFNYCGIANKYVLNNSNNVDGRLTFYTGYRYKQQATEQATYTTTYNDPKADGSGEDIVKDVGIIVLKDSKSKNTRVKPFIGQLFDKDDNPLTPEPTALAEVYDDYPNYICLLFNHINYYFVNPKRCCELFREILRWYGKEIKHLVEDDFFDFIKEEISEAEDYEEKAKRNALNKFIKKQSEKPLKDLAEKAYIQKSKALDLQREYMYAITKYYDLKDQYEVLEQSLNSENNEIINDIKDVKRGIPLIKDIYVDESDSNKLIMITDSIYSMVNGLRYYFGEFKVVFNFYTSSNYDFVRFYNLNDSCRRPNCWTSGYDPSRDPKKQGHHPHVSVDGTPCLGNASDLFLECKKSLDITGLAGTALSFLQSVNTADVAGKHVTSWDEVDEQGRVIQKGYYHRETPPNKRIIYCDICGAMVVGENNLYLSRDKGDDMNACHDCADKIVTCADCGGLTDINSATKCDKCGEYYCCTDCFTGSKIYSDKEGALCHNCHLEKELESGNIVDCSICGEHVNADEQYTCEKCGTTGCSGCIQVIDGQYVCNNCK